ncbi:MAG: hypothetical protein KGZ25_07300, partial [Planctomycetes bacterium]|nr:hypothetical protein [Planctomycetota bacterium]
MDDISECSSEAQKYADCSPAKERETGHCPYCGAELDPDYYFCTRCATPYKHFRKILLRALPPHLSTGERI